MKFGVVLCPHCKTAKGASLFAKTTVCIKCGKRIDLKKAKVLCKVETEKEVASAVMEYNTKLKGGEDLYANDLEILEGKNQYPDRIVDKSSDVYERIISKLTRIRGRDEKIVTAARELCHYLGEFTENDFFEILKRIGIEKGEDCRKYIEKMMAEDVIYEPKLGVYKSLENLR